MWNESDIAQFEEHWPIGSRERFAFTLLLYTGQRRGDVIRLGRQHAHGKFLELRQGKTGADV
jgi:integrase